MPLPSTIAFRSPPAQKFLPAPVRMAMLSAGSASKRANASTSAAAVARSTAFATCCRSIMMVTTSASVSYRTVIPGLRFYPQKDTEEPFLTQRQKDTG
jgi:hypothetical protein